MSAEIKLFHADCFDLIKEIQDGVVNAVITDPPYGMNYLSGRREKKHKRIENDSNLEWISFYIDEIDRITNENSSIYLFCSHHKIDIFKRAIEKKFKLKNILIWEKNNHTSGDLKGAFGVKTEFIIYATKGVVHLNGRRDANIIKFNKTQNNFHPTEKPVELIDYLIAKSTNKNDMVFDGFMGSGTTGVSCAKAQRKFIGIEKDEEYFKVASMRIDKTIKDIESDLFYQLEKTNTTGEG